MRRLTSVAGLAAVAIIVTGGVASADTRAAQLFGPFPNKIQCVAKQNDADKGGWTITAPCHSTAVGKWWFKAAR